MRQASTQLKDFTNNLSENAKAPVTTGAYTRVKTSQRLHGAHLNFLEGWLVCRAGRIQDRFFLLFDGAAWPPFPGYMRGGARNSSAGTVTAEAAPPKSKKKGLWVWLATNRPPLRG